MPDPRPHDLVRVVDRGDLPLDWLRPARLRTGAACTPDTASASDTVWAVVRRARVGVGDVAIGFRGPSRGERLGVIVPIADVREVVSPEDARRLINAGPGARPSASAAPGLGSRSLSGAPSRRAERDLPARHALEDIAPVLDGVVPGRWGPTGSVGFEVVTGLASASETSDLDLLIRAPRPLDLATVRTMMEDAAARAGTLGVRLDVQVDTGAGGFAVGEWMRTGSSVVLRTSDGPRAVADPWEE